MTAYNLKPPETLPSFAWQKAKEKRKKLLEERIEKIEEQQELIKSKN